MKHTKIVATIGPASESPEALEQLINAGLNVARLNMSHGDHEEHGARFTTIRNVSQELGKPIAILVDLSGPKIRTGDYVTERITICGGDTIVLTTEPHVGDASRIYINYPKLAQEVKPGTFILLDDGKKKLEVQKIEGTEIHCLVVVGGELKPRRGVNVPGAYLSIDTITEKDKKDVVFGVKNGADFFAISFVRKAEDVHELRAILSSHGVKTPIISKIETQEAIENLDAIIEASDGIMVARGDLASEVPAEMVPLYQKEMIAKCNAAGKPVITATQMLDSMISSPVPTRAEVSDIANAIADGTDAIMLSEESALGKHATAAVAMMARIAHAVESHENQGVAAQGKISDAISTPAAQIARDLGAKCIVVMTETGGAVRRIAKHHPHCPIIALTRHSTTVQQLTLQRGVQAYFVSDYENLDTTIAKVPVFLKEHGLAAKGDRIVLTAGMSHNISGSSNMIIVLEV
jgi:pyruvate kinase